MPEIPDFKRLAHDLLDAYDPDVMADRSIAIDIAEQLRLVWNARGAADMHVVEDRLSTLTGWITSEPYRHNLRDAIDTLNVSPGTRSPRD